MPWEPSPISAPPRSSWRDTSRSQDRSEAALMASEVAATPAPRLGVLDRALRVFSDVRAGEGGTVVLMFANLLTLLVGYYVIKTLRDTVIVARLGAEGKAYWSAGMAIVLMGCIPL